MRKKPANRRIARADLKPKRNFTKAIPFLLCVILITGLVFGVRFLLLSYHGFKIKAVTVVNKKGETLAGAESIFRPDENLSLFGLNMKKTTRDIQKRYPEFAFVRIRKQFPDKVLIVVETREAVAFVASRGGYLVDSEGFILPYDSGHKELPKIVGVKQAAQLYQQSHSLRLKKALDLLKQLKEAEVYPKHKIAKINVSKYNNIVLYLENKVEIKMGEGELSKKARLLSKILEQLEATETVPKYIDMRFGNPVVKPRK